MTDRTLSMMEYEDWRPRLTDWVDRGWQMFLKPLPPEELKLLMRQAQYENLSRLLGNIAGMGAASGLQNDPRAHRIGCNCPMCGDPSDTEPRGLLYSLFGL